MTNKKVLLINPKENFTSDNDRFPRLGLLLLGTVLEKKGHEVKLIHMVTDKVKKQDLTNLLRSFQPDIVGITLSTYQTVYTKIISKDIKQWANGFNGRVKVVVGGPHPSALKEEIFETFPNVDIVVVGEGEQALIEIVEEKPLKDIKGIIYKDHEQVIINEERLLLQDLDTLPFPNLNLVQLKNFSGPYPIGKRPCFYVMGARGCPNQCIFCFKGAYKRTVRFHSPEYIIENVEYLNKVFGVKEIYFEDETFNLNRKWAEEVLKGLIRKGLNKKVDFRTACRVDEKLVDLELLKLMKEANFWSIFYGVESGNQVMLDRMKKGITLEEVRRAIKLTHSIGIKTVVPFIVGLPGETEETIKDSIALYKELKPYIGGFGRAIPLPGTEFYNEVKEKGHLLETNYDKYFYSKMLVRTDSLSSEELENWTNHGNKLVLKDLAIRCLTDPELLLRTLKAVGWKELVSKVLRNIK